MTALSFDLDAVDAAVVAWLKSPGNLSVHVGSVTDSDASSKTISAPLPYVLFGSNLPFDTSPRVGGGRAGTTEFALVYVNSTDQGCKAVARAVRTMLDGHDLGNGLGRIRLSGRFEPVIVRRDDTWTRPDGGPLFNATDRYFVA